MATLEKVFSCLSCGAQIKLERKPDNSGWNKYNLDSTPHVDEKRKNNSSSSSSSSQTQQKIDELTTQISELRSEIKNLAAVVQFLRMEFSKEKEKEKEKEQKQK